MAKSDVEKAKTELKKREFGLDEREKAVRAKKTRVNNLQKSVERGLYDNTNRQLKSVESELEELREFCGTVKRKDGASVLEMFERKQEEEQERSRGWGRER